MKTGFLKMVGVLALSLVLAVSARALSFGDANSLGSIIPGVPDSDTPQVALVNVLLDLATGNDQVRNVFSGPHDPYTFDRTGNYQPGTALDDAVVAGAVKDDTGTNSIDLGGGYLYLMAKYGGGGEVPGIDANNSFYVWYVGGLDGIVSVPGQGLSHISLYNPGTSIPDSGMTSVLVGLGLVFLSVLARRRI